MAFIYNIKSLYDLQNNLEYCDQLFISHQLALMHKDNEQALVIFEELYKYRRRHLEIMESILIPAFEKCQSQIPAGAREKYFLREKKLIEKELNKFVHLLSERVLNPSKSDLVNLFEEYTWLKDLLDHHDAREKAFLFPVLEQNLSAAEKNNLIKELSQIFNE